MKNGDLFTVKNLITSISQEGANRYKMSLMLNEELVDSRIEKLEKLVESSEDMDKYREEFQELAINHSEKNSDGDIILYERDGGLGKVITSSGRGMPNIMHDLDVFNSTKEELDYKYKETIDAHQAKIDAYVITLEEDVTDLTLISIDYKDIPELDYHALKLLKQFGLLKNIGDEK
jgi:hypothetical protein